MKLSFLFPGLLAVVLTAFSSHGATFQTGDGAHPQLFVTSDECLACHNNLTTPSGADVSIGTTWRASMMANSSRDPYWQAAVRREILDHPESQAAIEEECAKCHMPMASYSSRVSGRSLDVFSNLPTERGDGEIARLAADGVSCSTCHQIQPDNFGEEESFTGGFLVDTTREPGDRHVFGPFEVTAGLQKLMQSASTFLPEKGGHLQESELCATCHTLYTHALGPEGETVARLPEQVPYLEWRHSSYSDKQSCQSCHMPVVEEPTPISSTLGEPRDGFSRHVFRGGNFFMLRILNRYRNELAVEALPHELDAAARETIDHLQTSTARIFLEAGRVSGGRLEVSVIVRNRAGHKLPTAYPSRRVWINLTVHDASGNIVFESGRFRDDGSIEGNDNDRDPELYEPHYQRIDAPGKVQIYESIMVDRRGSVTTGLLTGVRYTKDNRILPRGFNKETASADIAVYGRASEDPNFRSAQHKLVYLMKLEGSTAPYRIEAKLWYQPIAFRWAQNLRFYEASEIKRFIRFYESMSAASAVVLASDSALIEEVQKAGYRRIRDEE